MNTYEFDALMEMARDGQLQPFIMKNKVYTGAGCATSRTVTVYEGQQTFKVPCCSRDRDADGNCDQHKNNELDPAPSQAIRNHSPAGFNWGFGGSGPHQLALAILLDFTGDAEIAQRYYRKFLWAHVATWSDTWKITGEQIHEWLVEERLK